MIKDDIEILLNDETMENPEKLWRIMDAVATSYEGLKYEGYLNDRPGFNDRYNEGYNAGLAAVNTKINLAVDDLRK